MKSDIVDQLFSQYYNEALLFTISLCRNRTVAEDIVSAPDGLQERVHQPLPKGEPLYR